MKILVTGAAGLVGSHLCELLISKGHTVKGLIHYNGDKIAHLPIETIRGDIRFIDECMEATEDVDAVAHLAALIHVDRSRRYPRLFWETNVGGTMNMLEAARKRGLRYLHMSTCEVVGNVPTGKADEKHPFQQPLSPYAASKYAAEAYCRAYHATYDLDIRVARCFNISGPRQKQGGKGAVIPIFIDKVIKGEPPLIYGSGNQIRDYTDVRDTVRGLADILGKPGLDGELIHLCSGIGHSVNEIAEKVLKALSSNVEPVHVAARPGELMRSVGDNSKAKRLLGWSPQINLEHTIWDTIEYIERVSR